LFVKTYNGKYPTNQLDAAEVHLENDSGESFANECLISDYIESSSDVYMKHGAAPALREVTATRTRQAKPPSAPGPAATTAAASSAGAAVASGTAAAGTLVSCKRFGCQKKYDPAGNHEGACSFHRLPPVFHETAKFWACCSEKKCYSWDSFLEVKGCCTGFHTDEKTEQPQVLGGQDVRSGNDGSEEATERLKTIEEYNAEQRANKGGASGAGEAISKLYQLRQALDKAGVAGETFDAAKEKLAVDLAGDHVAVAEEMAKRLSGFLSSVAQGTAP